MKAPSTVNLSLIVWLATDALARASRPGYPADDPRPDEVEAWLSQAQVMGIRSVLCLLSDGELDEYYHSQGIPLLKRYAEAGLTVAHLPVLDYQKPPLTKAQGQQALRHLRRLPRPVVVHCSAGIDRTGFVVRLAKEAGLLPASAVKSSPKASKIRRTKAPAPLVGIFWVEGREIHSHAVPVSQGERYSDCINGPIDHVDYWPELQRQHPQLQGRDYSELPRGRVVYRGEERCFAVLMDRRLHTPAIKAALARRFQLPPRRRQFETDAHYTTDPAALDRLFED